jgi:golgi resident protein GCP60
MDGHLANVLNHGCVVSLAEKKDIEKGATNSNKPPKPFQDEIVPIFRRDCHEEIYAGSHTYPGHGVYLLKFDNSYSLWRSKTLYYRVYYSR